MKRGQGTKTLLPDGSWFRPLGNCVVIRRAEDRPLSLIIITPDTAEKQPPIEGTVLAVGPDVDITLVGPGDQVIFSKYGGTTVKLFGEELLIVKADDVQAVILESAGDLKARVAAAAQPKAPERDDGWEGEQ